MDRIARIFAPTRQLNTIKALRTPTSTQWPPSRGWCWPKNPASTPLSQASSFSTSPVHQARKKNKGPKKDTRITLIRYHLQHPKTPRPLRFGRFRYLRHWTIHRAWQLHRANLRKQQQLELEKQWKSMRDACEELRLIGEDGLTVAEGGGGKGEGRLLRVAIAQPRERLVPIEYARALTDWPSKEGWNHGWTRG